MEWSTKQNRQQNEASKDSPKGSRKGKMNNYIFIYLVPGWEELITCRIGVVLCHSAAAHSQQQDGDGAQDAWRVHRYRLVQVGPSQRKGASRLYLLCLVLHKLNKLNTKHIQGKLNWNDAITKIASKPIETILLDWDTFALFGQLLYNTIQIFLSGWLICNCTPLSYPMFCWHNLCNTQTIYEM